MSQPHYLFDNLGNKYILVNFINSQRPLKNSLFFGMSNTCHVE